MPGIGPRVGTRARRRPPSIPAPPALFDLDRLPAGALVAWWDARNTASLSLSGQTVASWTDTVRGHVLAQATAGSRPIYDATGWNGTLPAIGFDGSTFNGDILTTEATLADRLWIFMLVERGATQNNGAGSTVKTLMTVSRPSDLLYSQFGFIRPNSDAGQTQLSLSAWGSSSSLTQAAGGLAAGAKAVVFADAGRLIRANAGSGAVVSGSSTGTRLELSLGGSLSHDHNRAAFKVAEIVVLDPTVLKGDGADNQRWVVEGLLAHRWGTAGLLPARHPFGAAPPAAADWTGNAREIVTWGNSVCAGFTPSIPSGWSATHLSNPPLTNGGAGGETSTQVRARFDAAAPRTRECINVIGDVFTNGNGGAGNPTTRAHIDHMAGAVLAAGGRAIVLDHHINNLDTHRFGTAGRAELDANNAALKAEYPNSFLDVSEFVYQLGAPGALYDDPAQYAIGLPPSAAMADNVHYTAAVYAMIGRDHIGGFIRARGWDR